MTDPYGQPNPYGQQQPPYPGQPYGPAQPQPYQQPMQQPAAMMVVGPPTSGFATASLVFGLIGFFGGWCMFGLPCVVAVVLGHIALNETKNGRRGGHGMAITGLILGYLLVIPAVIIAIMLFAGGLGSAMSGTSGSTP